MPQDGSNATGLYEHVTMAWSFAYSELLCLISEYLMAISVELAAFFPSLLLFFLSKNYDTGYERPSLATYPIRLLLRSGLIFLALAM